MNFPSQWLISAQVPAVERVRLQHRLGHVHRVLVVRCAGDARRGSASPRETSLVTKGPRGVSPARRDANHLVNKRDDGVLVGQYGLHVVVHVAVERVHALAEVLLGRGLVALGADEGVRVALAAVARVPWGPVTPVEGISLHRAMLADAVGAAR